MEFKYALIMALLAGILLLSGCLEPGTKDIEPTQISTFTDTGAEICTQGGKPVIRLFSTTTCPHCMWIRGAFDSTAREYAEAGKIVAHHWELDTGQDILGFGSGGGIPDSETEIFRAYNPRNTVPTFVFGCKYLRVGNAYESQNDLDAEVGEFKAVFEALISEAAAQQGAGG